VKTRRQTQYQGFCEWCGIPISTWYSHRSMVKMWEATHRQLHEAQNRVGESIRAQDYPKPVAA